jgi:hypothetical protein
MSIAQSMLPEFDHEMANTRKTLERIPLNKLEWKPDPKSMSLGRLAGHVISSKEQMLGEFDKNVIALRAALSSAKDESMMQTWSLKMNGSVLFSMPRVAVMRSMIMNHIIHHRAQLTVYYRLNGVAVPALYGPSADENSMQASA